MSAPRQSHLSGGCQCGTVRYAIYGQTQNPHICHCRMCQKAFGSFFAPLVGVKRDDFAWTKDKPSVFKSSEGVERSFCGNCGTPLSFAYVGSDRMAVSIGSLDDPTRIKPGHQYGIESRVPYFAELDRLPASRTEDDIPAAQRMKLKSRQHPDHD